MKLVGKLDHRDIAKLISFRQAITEINLRKSRLLENRLIITMGSRINTSTETPWPS